MSGTPSESPTHLSHRPVNSFMALYRPCPNGHCPSRSQSPRRQCRLGTRWIVLDAVNGPAAQPRFLGNLSGADSVLTEHVADGIELSSHVARLAPKISTRVIGLGMLDSGALSGFCRFGLACCTWPQWVFSREGEADHP